MADRNTDERSAASTGADTERHRSNDLNPASAPALSLPPQRLGSAMEGLPELKRLAEMASPMPWESPPDVPHSAKWEFQQGCTPALVLALFAEVEALRQRPGTQGEYDGVTTHPEFGPGAQAPRTAAPVRFDVLYEIAAAFSLDYNEVCKVAASVAAPSTGGAETAAVYGFDRENLEAVAEGLATGYEASINVGNVTGMGDDHLESTTAYAARFIRTVLASSAPASSTGGTETAEPCQQGCFEKIEGRTACVGRCKQAARAAASSSAPAQAVETAGVREQDFEKGWRTAANWMERDDLIADIGGAAYLKDRAAALQSPAASPASKEQTNGGPSHE